MQTPASYYTAKLMLPVQHFLGFLVRVDSDTMRLHKRAIFNMNFMLCLVHQDNLILPMTEVQ